MQKFILDTNFILALLQIGEPLHKKAVDMFTDLNGTGSIIVPYVVVCELCAGKDPFEILLTLGKIGLSIINPEPENINQFQHIPKSSRRSLKANDCQIIAHCLEENAKLVSFDKRLIKALTQAKINSAKHHKENIEPYITTT